MNKTIVIFFLSFSFLISFHSVLSEKLGIQKKKKNLEQDAMHALMKKLESLYKLSATDNSEIFNKEMEALKKQIDHLQQHGGANEEESLGHLLESEDADDSGKKTIFGVDEDDLDNYDADFTGQSKGKIKGQADAGQTVESNVSPRPASSAAADSPPRGTAADGRNSHVVEIGYINRNSADSSPLAAGSGGDSTLSASGPGSASQITQPSPSSPGGVPGNTLTNVQPQTPVGAGGGTNTPGANQQAGSTPPGAATAQTEGEREPNVKYLDKLYDDVLATQDSANGIDVPPFHSKYNDFRKKYEFKMNDSEYKIMKNLFDVCFKKEGQQSSAACLVNVFKKVLDDEHLQKEFDNFVHGFYGFAKRHNYLRGERMANENLYKDIFKNVVNLLNTIEVV
ncbi:merozoite surface protein 7 (MSP7) [Plasmodium vivax North Korean]|uniref:Merozoite surface protein 7 (MSP7) n=1 Tax=Plasmodium vivax North Korean TaxID=1035514 RepID=A0A0J9WBP3_PLAVI|nr:merozoite surface protein 7 (MSP7) [Plasmodium vivax North Korean]